MPAFGVKTDGAIDACTLEPLCDSCETVADPPIVARGQSRRNAGVSEPPRVCTLSAYVIAEAARSRLEITRGRKACESARARAATSSAPIFTVIPIRRTVTECRR